ncbi:MULTISPECIES: HD domain-containing protein [unclassified Mucilaginibacter]|uniref:HD domain-containing protein n=1 Tax=unclassified Mucilaginibacter TaxID=2617802 RepID=UPI002AC904FB|nr:MULTISPECIES: HD domain-containing protein [unclassified Mucilaginibacter]MEB0249310.1 HD domain-containing protein [Mucilaginibacter sp. 5B2]MEB0261713.1 HD domain-containing protein [Mucilaginibacter sp. 10I4]MEB0278363.1 HD domain-containing protein [Mucilaginibacter sp. 10B2]MEB0301016.1 HD domain-containing protein [Mucilaginibacter sp. 5C4]WPX24008.1 HD domain-containing protein [Mucilaginibacter sp. 5C4]
MNKKKIINDPVYGFISIPTELVYDLIDHPYFQRLRYIKQLGMTHLVYPGALHTRFHHALGAMHLMSMAIETLCNKGAEISPEEKEGLMIAILLHDIGHGPFSHALEHTIVDEIDHEDISILLMNKLNEEFEGKLSLAISIFTGSHPKHFLHQLVSSQLDMDRMDYLNRDSYFTGVSEGVISSDRIIKMLTVKDDSIAVEEKGIYSIEKFLIARRLMYWQVYLHKTVIAAEQLLCKIFTRSRELALQGTHFPLTPALSYFLENFITKAEFMASDKHLKTFALLDDTDVMAAVKIWADSPDFVLSKLCHNLINRRLYHVDITNEVPNADFIKQLTASAMEKYNISEHEASYFVFDDDIRNNAYNKGDGNIHILKKNGDITDITLASDNSNLEALSKTVKKYILCYAKELF